VFNRSIAAILFIASAAIAVAQSSPASPSEALTSEEQQQRYENWAVNYRSDDVSGMSLLGLKLAVTAIDGEELEYKNRRQEKATRHYYLLGVGGSQFVLSDIPNWAIHRDGMDPASALKLKQVDDAIYKLPDDQSVLPPADRRLVFQVPGAGGVTVRVYDRRNLPSEIVAILKILEIARAPYQLPPAPH